MNVLVYMSSCLQFFFCLCSVSQKPRISLRLLVGAFFLFYITLQKQTMHYCFAILDYLYEIITVRPVIKVIGLCCYTTIPILLYKIN